MAWGGHAPSWRQPCGKVSLGRSSAREGVVNVGTVYKVPLVLTPQPEGGFTVTSPVLPELVTEGDTLEEALANVPDALKAVVEVYEDLGRPLPANLRQDPDASSLWFECLVAGA